MKIFFKLIWEGLVFAVRELVLNKTRTFLSLLGISIGIFAIISVFTIFDSMEINLRSSLNSLGSNVLFVQKWPWAGGNNYPWWKYMKRPQPTLKDLKTIEKNSEKAAAVSFMVGKSKTLKNNNNIISNTNVEGVSYPYAQIMSLNIEQGRYFTHLEVEQGRRVAIIGAKIAETLFPNENALDKTFKIGGSKATVIGVLKKEGEGGLLGISADQNVFIPIKFMQSFIDIKRSSNTILAQAKPNVSNDELIGELTGLLRASHRLKPTEEDDFAINETSIASKVFDEIFKVLATVGWIIGSFSLLVGGFGVANIMFISVKERTRIIGIQKALGAKNYFILIQFLFESVFLSVMGGILGLFIVWLLVLVLGKALDFSMVLTLRNIALGIGVSSLIGLLSGLLPSFQAARLNPVEAIRSNG